MATISWKTTTELEAEAHEAALAALRAERDRRLAACDYVMMPDYPISEAGRGVWEAYRQALRDLPEQADGLSAQEVRSLAFPESPEPPV